MNSDQGSSLDLASTIAMAERLQPSEFALHDDRCCRLALTWFAAISRASHWSGGFPDWIRSLWRWGPQTWPLSWCEVVRRPALDCGGLAALARAAAYYREHSFQSVQLVIEFNESSRRHWRRSWIAETGSFGWMFGTQAYHEAVAIGDGDGVRVWDPTENTLVDCGTSTGYARPRAIRFSTAVGGRTTGPVVKWQDSLWPVGPWTILRSDPRGSTAVDVAAQGVEHGTEPRGCSHSRSALRGSGPHLRPWTSSVPESAALRLGVLP